MKNLIKVLVVGLVLFTSCNKNKKCMQVIHENNSFNYKEWYDSNSDIQVIEERFNDGFINNEQREQYIDRIVEEKLTSNENKERTACGDL